MRVTFLDSGREPQCPPNPAYPKGTNLDMSEGAANVCLQPLPYPAPRCGLMVVACDACGLRVAITVAGRPDDPRSVKLKCLNGRR